VGVSLSLHRHILILYPLFSLAQEAQEKSLAKKKRHGESFAACERRPTLRALDGRKPLKRLDRNFNAASRCSHEAPHKPQFPAPNMHESSRIA